MQTRSVSILVVAPVGGLREIVPPLPRNSSEQFIFTLRNSATNGVHARLAESYGASNVLKAASACGRTQAEGANVLIDGNGDIKLYGFWTVSFTGGGCRTDGEGSASSDIVGGVTRSVWTISGVYSGLPEHGSR